jgi:hypothetical protein
LASEYEKFVENPKAPFPFVMQEPGFHHRLRNHNHHQTDVLEAEFFAKNHLEEYAKHFGVSVDTIRAWNLDPVRSDRPGEMIRSRVFTKEEKDLEEKYKQFRFSRCNALCESNPLYAEQMVSSIVLLHHSSVMPLHILLIIFFLFFLYSVIQQRNVSTMV